MKFSASVEKTGAILDKFSIIWEFPSCFAGFLTHCHRLFDAY
jgi:hypothetical protein